MKTIQTIQTMSLEIIQENELVIKGDHLYKRESFLSPLGNIDHLLNERMKQDVISFLPLKFPPLLSKWVNWTIFGQLKKQLYLISSIQYFPLNGAGMVKNAEGIYRLQTALRHGDLPENTTLFSGPAKWDFPENYKAFVMVPMAANHQLEAPSLFGVLSESISPVTPKLPNIYADGKICTGSSYRSPNESTAIQENPENTLMYFKHALNNIHSAPINSDLRVESVDHKFLQWTKENDEPEVQLQIPLENKHTYEITDDRIIQFVTWAKENGIL